MNTRAIVPNIIIRAMTAFLVVLWCTAGLATDRHPAQALVVDSTEKVLQILDENSERIRTDGAFLQKIIDTHITPNIDFISMTKLAVGKNWRKASATQKRALTKQFRQLLLNTYSKSLTQYSGQRIEFLPYREGKREDRAQVRSQFTPTGGAAIPIYYKLLNKGSWKIYDILIDGISLVTNYRTGFTRKINSNGIDGLIAELTEKNAGK